MAEKADAGRVVEFQGKRYWIKEALPVIDGPMDFGIVEDSATMWRRFWVQRWAEESIQRTLQERPPITVITGC